MKEQKQRCMVSLQSHQVCSKPMKLNVGRCWILGFWLTGAKCPTPFNFVLFLKTISPRSTSKSAGHCSPSGCPRVLLRTRRHQVPSKNEVSANHPLSEFWGLEVSNPHKHSHAASPYPSLSSAFKFLSITLMILLQFTGQEKQVCFLVQVRRESLLLKGGQHAESSPMKGQNTAWNDTAASFSSRERRNGAQFGLNPTTTRNPQAVQSGYYGLEYIFLIKNTCFSWESRILVSVLLFTGNLRWHIYVFLSFF